MNVVSYSLSTKYTRGPFIGIAPRFGYVVGNNLIYIKPGIEISRDKISAAYNFANSSSNRTLSYSASTSKTNIAITPAVGYERAYGSFIFRGEYTRNLGKKVSINSNIAALSSYDNASYSDHRFIIGVAYKF